MTTKKSEINTTKHKVTIKKCKTTIITATRRKKKTNRSKMITKIHRVNQYDYKDTKLRDVR